MTKQRAPFPTKFMPAPPRIALCTARDNPYTRRALTAACASHPGAWFAIGGNHELSWTRRQCHSPGRSTSSDTQSSLPTPSNTVPRDRQYACQAGAVRNELVKSKPLRVIVNFPYKPQTSPSKTMPLEPHHRRLNLWACKSPLAEHSSVVRCCGRR